MLLFTFCSKEDAEPELITQDTEAINAFFNTIPDWEIPDIEIKADSIIETIEVIDENTEESYDCDIFERNMVSTINDFVSVGTNLGVIWPGAMIQGNSIETGNLRLISANQKRAPITLTTNLALDKTSIIIDPNSVNAQQAIADFMIAAGKMPEGSQSAGTMNFLVEEAITFEQSMRQMGVSAGFTEPESKAGLEGSLTVANTRSSKSHTVVAKFVQEMFTVRVADDLIATPADFFTNDFTMTELKALESKGELGEDNIPVYIESVTYGRILLFSSTSDNVSTADSLAAALEASMADYAKLGGEYKDAYQKIMNSTRHKIFSAGGTDKAANELVGNLDWSKFFVESPASTAVPISFKARTVNGKQIVGLVHNSTVQRRDECSLNVFLPPPPPEVDYYEVTVEWTNTDNTGLCFGGSGTLGSCSPAAYVKLGKETAFTRLTIAGGYSRTFIIDPETDQLYLDFTVRSFTRLKIPWPYQGFTTKTATSKFYVDQLPASRTFSHLLSNFAGSARLSYRITVQTVNK